MQSFLEYVTALLVEVYKYYTALCTGVAPELWLVGEGRQVIISQNFIKKYYY